MGRFIQPCPAGGPSRLARRGLLLCALCALGALPLGAAELPGWWRAFLAAPRLSCNFVQESESAVFGKLRKEGTLQAAQGGRLRVAYRKGLVLVADGRTLIQYNPETRTAQSADLRSMAAEAPLLTLLLDARALEGAYTVQSPDGRRVVLEPRRKGLARVELEGSGAALSAAQWTDPTGARQRLALSQVKLPGSFPAGTFSFQAPAGTRWIGGGREPGR